MEDASKLFSPSYFLCFVVLVSEHVQCVRYENESFS